jgi:hypothetical protein
MALLVTGRVSALSLLCAASPWLLAACSGGGPECAQDRDCPPGNYCRAGVCGYDCNVDADCPDGFACSERGRCQRGCVESNGGVEACDGMDNDCDDEVDEDFPELGDACQNAGCPPGRMVCTADGGGVVCDGPQPAADDPSCDGHDDDCDGQTDEDAAPRPCPLSGGVCREAEQRCEDGAWTGCDYGPDYTAGIDANCDGRDEDCDGETDEDAAVLPLAEDGDWAGDGVDNNCSGVVDEPGGVMVPVPGQPGVAIDAYELVIAAADDCSGARYGQTGDDYPAGFPPAGSPSLTLYACSLPGVLPSGHLSWHRARWACQAQGKRLCSKSEYYATCVGDPITYYPYGNTFIGGACNCGLSGGRQPAATGSFPDCHSSGAWDMSGNLNEWLADDVPAEPDQAMAVGFGYSNEICYRGDSCHPCDPDNPEHTHRIEMAADCSADPDRSYEKYGRSDVKAYLGSRCCWDSP